MVSALPATGIEALETLPAFLRPPAEACAMVGNAALPDGGKVWWTAATVRVQTTDGVAEVRRDALVPLQLSRASTAQRALGGLVRRRPAHRVHVTLRDRHGARLTLQAQVPDATALRVLPVQEGTGPVLALDDLRALLGSLVVAGVGIARTTPVTETGQSPSTSLPPRPPREVPWSVALRLHFDRFVALGWLCTAFILGMAMPIVGRADLSGGAFEGQRERAVATVTRVRSVAVDHDDAGENVTVFAYDYRFAAAGVTYSGTSYSAGTWTTKTVDQPTARAHPVEFPVGHPEVSRLVGKRRDVYPADQAWLLLVLLLGIPFVVLAHVRGWRRVELLRRGVLVEAEPFDSEAIMVPEDHSDRDPPRMIVRMLRYVDDVGLEHRIHVPNDTGPSLLLFDADFPRRRLLLSRLPSTVRLDREAGAFVEASVYPAILRLALPLGLLALNVLWYLVVRTWV